MIEIEAPDGSVVEFPPDTPREVMSRAMSARFGGQPQFAPAPTPAPAPVAAGPQMTPNEADLAVSGIGQPVPEMRPGPPPLAGDSIAGIGKAAVQGPVTGLNNLLDLPVNAVNQAPRLVNPAVYLINKIMGRDAVPYAPAISEHPLLPSDILHAPDRALGSREYKPQGPIERIVDRAGQEVGASAVPALGALTAAGRIGAAGAREMMLSGNPLKQIAAPAVEAAVVNPTGVVGREASGAVAAGIGAGAANESARAVTGSDHNPISDLVGAITGTAGLALSKPIVGAAKSMAGTAFGSTKMADDVARETVALDLLANSTEAQRQAVRGVDRGSIDAQPLADQLRRPSEVERVIPGYQADIADRSGDPGLAAYAFNKTAQRPGLDAGRRAANQGAVEDRMAQLAPDGSAGQFRADLQGGVERRVGVAETQAEIAQRTLDEHAQRLASTMTGEARGADIRAALQRAKDTADQGVRDAYEPINRATQQVDVAPLAQRFGGIDESLSVAERERFRPNEANIPDRLIGPAEATGPVDTGLLDASGRPITREPRPGNSQQPIREVTGIRSALTDEARAARTANRPAEARIIDQHVTALDDYLDGAVPEGLRGQYDAARATRRDVADRFERPQNAIPQVLSERQGVYNVPDSGVAPRFAQSEEGRLTDLQQLMREAGGDVRVRPALRDQFLANIRDRGLLDRPEQLNGYLDRHATLLDQLPGLRDELTAGGAASRASAEARTAADTTRRDLTTPGRSPEASYLKNEPGMDVESMRTVIGAAKPAEAARQILETAGGSRANARAALWEVVKKETTTNGGIGASGRQETNGLRGDKLFSDPRFDAVAKELYADAPEQLSDIKDVFSALSGTGSAARAKRPGSSGTAQASYDSALSAASIASRVRSVNRGQLSPTVAIIDVAATKLRQMSARLQKSAIENLQDEVVQNPQLAAKLLEDYNPANYAAKRRELLTIGGVRATEAVKLLDEAHDERERPEAAAVRRAGAR